MRRFNAGLIIICLILTLIIGGCKLTASNYILTTSVDSPGTGSVTLSPLGGTYPPGTQVSVTATAESGYILDHWSGDLSDSTNPATITMDSNKSITAHFTLSNQPFTFSDVVDTIMPSVVYIYAEGDFSSSSGSGVIMGTDNNSSYILTNRHVVEESNSVEVTLQDRQVYIASEIWQDDLTDLAVVKIDVILTTTAQFADPSTIDVGDWVIAVGHPLGLSPSEGGATVTAGIVSNLGRSFSISGISYYDIIQTDAAINPGNSGGPLVNLNGKVIGINSAISTEGQNIGYAINVNTAERVFEDIVTFGEVKRPFLGVVMEDITPALVSNLSLTPRVGALITLVVPDNPADLAGLQENDVIVRLGDEDITSVAQLITELWTAHEIGDTVSITYYRGDIQIQTAVTLVERPE